ncbi:hypothetical protein BY458DRAFT_535054 [Sporodiniella umbellata]|nr:hypothetical protein BY458DRAFT_535054 [Sporodiniella umbellata]
MSRPSESASNRVRGPTSALTSFLREQGIAIPNRSRRMRREEEANAESHPAAAMEAQEETETVQVSLPRRSTTTANKRKKKPESEDEETGPVASSSRKVAKGRARILFCVLCQARFVKEQEGQTRCESCRNGRSKKAVKPKRKKLAEIKKDPLKDAVPSLQDTCISTVAKYIDEVEAFGVMSEDSFEKLSKIICRNRKLNSETSKLFMEPYRRTLKFYDCTNMDENALKNVAHFCPRIEKLDLVYCGQIQDTVLKLYQDRLHQLKHLSLSGGFLITQEAWIAFFQSVGTRLEGFGCRHSNRFQLDCVESLVNHCPNLQRLDLGQLNPMRSQWLPVIAQLKHLQALHLAWPSEPIQEEDLLHLLASVGSRLTELSLRGFKDLTDRVLLEGILKYCPQLKKLNLELCDQLTAAALTQFFQQWQTPGLTHLNLARCFLINDATLQAIVHHSGHTLLDLNIHSLELLTPKGLEVLADPTQAVFCSQLTQLNCGFVRSMDDFVLKKLVTHCQSLQTLFVSGCPLLTNTVQTNPTLRIVGRETN